jgi:ubiquinone/menaquinone biosynthesis C-methylase UbiE
MKSLDNARFALNAEKRPTRPPEPVLDSQNGSTPILGGTAPRHATRTAQKLATFALGHTGAIQCEQGASRYLDVGCGNGFITEYVAGNFDEVVGIDMEPDRLDDFRDHARSKSNFQIMEMSAARIEFPDDFFSFVTSFEVLEHVADLKKSAQEMARVCRQGGVLVVSVPQVWFPFENHGVRLGRTSYERKIPLLPYFRPLHRKYSLARVFSSGQMDDLFQSLGFQLLATAYASPQFERAGAKNSSWESRLKFLRSILDRCESMPILRALTGVSMLKAYRKPL